MGNLLKTYYEKRDFKKTKEPKGKVHAGNKKTKQHQFVIQRHEASKLHYDFRLEMEGVLKSWAVPKEPSPDPKEKRLAVQAEDHPVEYATFEGDIPEGEYGAGHVDIWDRGEWNPLDKDPVEAYAKGKLSFELRGERLKGRWTLVRTKGLKGRGGKQNWLLLKAKDQFSDDAPKSKSNRRKVDAAPITRASKKPRKAKAQLGFIEPELATLVDQPPAGNDWIVENKFDGYRILSSMSRGKVQLYTRYGNDWSDRFAPIHEALSGIEAKSFLLDGELVARTEEGASDFQKLQNSLKGEKAEGELAYFVFDILELDGEDLRELPLYERKRRLEKLLKSNRSERIYYSEHTVGNADDVFRQACGQGREGIICKRIDSSYRSGRAEDWLKVKCVQRQEFVIVGYTEPKGKRERFGALLLASRASASEPLTYVGKVGTGFNRETLDDLHRRLRKVETKKSALPEDVKEKNVHWVKPSLVAEITFTGWTNDKILRHPSFEGLREDKPSTEVRIEKEKPLSEVVSPSREVEKRGRLTSPDKILFSGQGVTKQELADHYELVSDLILPHLLNRPLTLVRCPRGDEQTCFFQKHYQKGTGPGIEPVFVEEKTKNASHVSIISEEGLISLAQMGVLEIHSWGATADDLDRPDQIVFDFDPDPTTSWEEVVDGLHELKDFLDELSLKSFLKLTGGKGAHIHIPIVRDYSWEEVRSFSEKVARKMEKRNPDTFTANPLKKERKGRLYLDYVRNNKGTTFVTPYSTRSKKDAPVATPILWEELTAKMSPDQFTVRNFAARMKKLKKDPWRDFAKSARKLPKIK